MIAVHANADGVLRLPVRCTIMAVVATYDGIVVWIKPRIRVKAGRRVVRSIVIGHGRRVERASFDPMPLDWMENP